MWIRESAFCRFHCAAKQERVEKWSGQMKENLLISIWLDNFDQNVKFYDTQKYVRLMNRFFYFFASSKKHSTIL